MSRRFLGVSVQVLKSEHLQTYHLLCKARNTYTKQVLLGTPPPPLSVPRFYSCEKIYRASPSILYNKTLTVGRTGNETG